jgi:threonine aldolase
VIAGVGAHLWLYEAGAAAALSGVQISLVGEGGFFGAEDLRRAIAPDDPHFPRTRLVCVENTHNSSGGRVFPLEAIREISAVARERGLALHLDGARIFNAEAATGTAVAGWAAEFDSVAFCLSKGLGAPVGSLLTGSRDFVRRARRFRKQFGGAMRQAGILAAAGLFALEHHTKRLADDHANARRLAAGLAELPDVRVPRAPETNMVFVQVPDAASFASRARERGVLIGAIDARTLRAVTHLDVSAADVEEALARLRGALP